MSTRENPYKIVRKSTRRYNRPEFRTNHMTREYVAAHNIGAILRHEPDIGKAEKVEREAARADRARTAARAAAKKGKGGTRRRHRKHRSTRRR
jgi:hypothetical protein